METMEKLELYRNFINSTNLLKLKIKICVLIMDYSTSTQYPGYIPSEDPRYYLTELPWEGEKVFINKSNVFSQIQEVAKKNYDVFFNLCNGRPEEDLPGVEVIQALESLNLPYVGSSEKPFRLNKKQQKQNAIKNGINTPNFYFCHSKEDLNLAINRIKTYPMFVKAWNSFCSIGLTTKCKVNNDDELIKE